MKNRVQPTRPDSSSLQTQISQDQAKSRQNPSRSDHFSTRSVEIWLDLNEIRLNPTKSPPPTPRSPSLRSVSFHSKKIFADLNRNRLDPQIPRLVTGQHLCHPNLADWFQVGHKPNLWTGLLVTQLVLYCISNRDIHRSNPSTCNRIYFLYCVFKG